MPVGDIPGWHQVFTEDFTTDVSTGSFPQAVSSKWSAYLDGWSDTSKNGTYEPSQVLSVHDGVLDMFIHSANGVHMVAAPVPIIPGATGGGGGLLYGRYVFRFKSDAIHGYKTAWLLWPDSEVWPQDGEIDFPEGDLDGTINAFMHYEGGTSGGSQDGYSSSITYTSWHTGVLEWTADHCSFTIDGNLLGSSTSNIPNTPMHWVLQTETTLDGYAPDDSAQGHVVVDWVAVYVPAP
jgi:beta-glucanase (GH16 family)